MKRSDWLVALKVVSPEQHLAAWARPGPLVLNLEKPNTFVYLEGLALDVRASNSHTLSKLANQCQSNLRGSAPLMTRASRGGSTA